MPNRPTRPKARQAANGNHRPVRGAPASAKVIAAAPPRWRPTDQQLAALAEYLIGLARREQSGRVTRDN
jgi:hypothetical protein